MSVEVIAARCPLCGPEFEGRSVASSVDFEYGTTGAQEFRFVQCAACACILLHPRPVDDAIASLYPPEYEPYRFDTLPPLVRAGRDWTQRKKVKLVREYAGDNAFIVDVGCGAGTLLRLLRAQGPSGWQLCGWDYPGPHMRVLAESGFAVVEGPIDEAHVPSGVDVFILNQVIEHFPFPADILEALSKALKPGGTIVIETPDIGGLDRSWFQSRHWGGYHTPRHMVLFNQQNLSQLVERCGLQVVSTDRLASPAFWIQSLHHTAAEAKFKKLAAVCTLRNLPLVAAFSAFDLARRNFGSTSNQRLVARKPS
ncbi:MAG: hypothetical protein RLZZ450_1116 [Pseudomonadota bacterium]|jgi:SAM-dependent methyltransferase